MEEEVMSWLDYVPWWFLVLSALGFCGCLFFGYLLFKMVRGILRSIGGHL